MGKLIRNGIEYGGGNGTDIFEVTQAQYNALKTAGTLVRDALYVITDAPNLNATANDLSMGSAPYASGSVGKAITDLQTDLSEKVTREYVAICGLTANSFRRIDINLNTIGSRTITINSVYTPGDATDLKSKFTIDNKTALGVIGLYSTDTSIVAGRPYIVNFTLS